jgi:hypothetical protein
VLAENYKIFPRHPNESNKFKIYCSTESNGTGARIDFRSLHHGGVQKCTEREVRSKKNTSILRQDLFIFLIMLGCLN